MRKQPSAISVSPEMDAKRDRLKLIRKLRWIGLDDEAARVVRSLPLDRRRTFLAALTRRDCLDAQLLI